MYSTYNESHKRSVAAERFTGMQTTTTTTTTTTKKDSQAYDNCVKNIYFDLLHDIVDRCNISEQ